MPCHRNQFSDLLRHLLGRAAVTANLETKSVVTVLDPWTNSDMRRLLLSTCELTSPRQLRRRLRIRREDHLVAAILGSRCFMAQLTTSTPAAVA